MSNDYAARRVEAVYQLGRLLDARTDQELRTLAWLTTWDVDTIDTLTGMIRRAVDVSTPALDDAAAVEDEHGGCGCDDV